jgi:hypothetical protein
MGIMEKAVKQKVKQKILLLAIYFVLAASFFIAYLFTDFIKTPGQVLFIVLNFVFAVLLSGGKNPFLLGAVATTIVADYLLAYKEFVVGIVFFILVQVLYFFAQNGLPAQSNAATNNAVPIKAANRNNSPVLHNNAATHGNADCSPHSGFVRWWAERKQLTLLCVWVALSSALAVVLANLIAVDSLLLFVACFYGVISIINNIFPKKNLLQIGILLLFICDFFILLAWFDLVGGFNYAWLFYIPSQAFVVLHSAL